MPNWKKVITSGSDASLTSIYSVGPITGSDLKINDWGSVSASLASLDASTYNDSDVTDHISSLGVVSGSSQITISDTTGYTTFSSSIASDIAAIDLSVTLQDATDNGAINRRAPEPTDSLADWASTDVNIIITGSLVAAAPGYETQYAHLQGNSLDLGRSGSTDTYIQLNGNNGGLRLGPDGSIVDIHSEQILNIHTDKNFLTLYTSGSSTSYIRSLNEYGPGGSTQYAGQVLKLVNSYAGAGSNANFNLNHQAKGQIGPNGGTALNYEYLTVKGAQHTVNDDVEVNLFGDVIKMSTTTGSFGDNPRVEIKQLGTEVFGNLTIDGTGITGMDGSINASGAITGSDLKINNWGSVSASLASIEASGASQTLQEVTDNGSTTTNSITVDSTVHVGRGGGSVTSNTAVGNNALGSNSTGTNNTAFGKDSLSSITDAHQNVAFGDGALRDLTLSGTAANTAVGYQALRDSTGTSQAVAIGNQSAVGATGDYFTAVGYQSLVSATGDENTALGYRALKDATSADQNTAVGTRALQDLTTGDNNTAIGKDAGLLKGNGGSNLTSANGVFLGYNTKPATQTSSNEIVIGYNAVGNGSNTVTIGNSSITDNYFSGNISGSDTHIDEWGSVSASLSSLNNTIVESGFVDVTGTPTSNQLAIYSDSNTIKSDTSFKVIENQLGRGSTYNQWDGDQVDLIFAPGMKAHGIELGDLNPASTPFTASLTIHTNHGATSNSVEKTAHGHQYAAGTHVVYTAACSSVMIHYNLLEDSAVRSGQLVVAVYGNEATLVEHSTSDIGTGDTTGARFIATASSNTLTLSIVSAAGGSVSFSAERMYSV